jgi:hypothetical protein
MAVAGLFVTGLCAASLAGQEADRVLGCADAEQSLRNRKKGPADAKGAEMSADGKLIGKVVMIYRKDHKYSSVEGEVRAVTLGNRTFLVGRFLSRDERVWSISKGLHWVPIEDVREMIVFDNADDARKYEEENRQARPETE